MSDERIIDYKKEDFNKDIASIFKEQSDKLKLEIELILAGNLPELLTVQKAAEYLDKKPQTIYKWMREGELSYIKIGSIPYIELRSTVEKKRKLMDKFQLTN